MKRNRIVRQTRVHEVLLKNKAASVKTEIAEASVTEETETDTAAADESADEEETKE